MGIVISAIVGLLFSLASLALMRMGASFLFPVGDLFRPQGGLQQVLPLIDDVKTAGAIMVAAGWFVGTFVGAYVSNVIARTIVGGWVVAGLMVVAAVLFAFQGAEPLWLMAVSLLLPLLAGRLAEAKVCSAPRVERRRRNIPVAVERRRAPAQPIGGLPGQADGQVLPPSAGDIIQDQAGDRRGAVAADRRVAPADRRGTAPADPRGPAAPERRGVAERRGAIAVDRRAAASPDASAASGLSRTTRAMPLPGTRTALPMSPPNSEDGDDTKPRRLAS